MSLRVLVGVDGSPFSDAAVRLALDLVSRRGEAELTALHVVNVVAPSGNLIKDLPGRLGFEPASDPLPRKEDGGLDLTRITAVEIVEVTDYHD